MTPTRKEDTCAGIMTFARVVGMMTPLAQWNPGKREEFKMRTSMNLDPFRQKQEEPEAYVEESACP